VKKRRLFADVIPVGAIFLFLVLLFGGCGGGGGGGSSGSGGGGGGGGTGTMSLEWDASTTNEDGTPLTDLAGYKIHYGTASGVYGHSVDVGNATAYQLSGLTKGQVYYLVVTAVNGSNTESDYSNELSGAAE